MAEPLKNVFTREFVELLSSTWKKLLPNLNEEQYAGRVLGGNWAALELKQRLSRLAKVTAQELPSDFDKSGPLIRKLTTCLVEANLNISRF